MDGFKRRSELKKKNILEAALSLYSEYGVQKVSVAEIAKKANVSQVTIYNYFNSKDNLTKHVFKYYVDIVWAEQKAILESDIPFNQKLHEIAFKKSSISNDVANKFLQDFLKDYSLGSSYVEEIYVKEALPKMMELFNEGKEKGFIDPTISNEAILVYLQMFKEYIQKENVAQMILPLTDDLIKLFYYGLVGKRED